MIDVRLSFATGSLMLLTVYRRGSTQLMGQFFDDLMTVVEVIILQQCQIMATGDFNIHIEEVVDASRHFGKFLLSRD